MKIKTILSGCVFLACAVISGCLYYPVPDDANAFSETCVISTPSWRLEHEIVDYSGGCNGEGEQAIACLAAWGVIIPAGSFIVSGSIYVVGNTVHWIEYQGVCTDSDLRTVLSKI